MELIMCKLNASEAFKHVKALWTQTAKIEKNKHYEGWTAISGSGVSLAGGSVGVEIDWEGEECYPVPVKVTYREPTLEDIKNGTQAEFCDTPAFQNNFVAKRKLAGITLVQGNVARGWVCDNGSVFTHCRVPVAIPAGWREITEADKITYGAEADDPDCDLITKDGRIITRCYYSKTRGGWKQYSGTGVENPIYIRKAQ